MPLLEQLAIFLDDTPRGGAEQMALDEAILETTERPVLRTYRWDGPAVSFGYSQSLGMVRELFAGVPVVRRWTGGGIVEHRGDWTFSLMVPSRDALAKRRPSETYELIHHAVVQVLAAEGVGTRLAGCEDRSSGAACFVAPALHDVLADNGQKLCGGAQRRTRLGFLHQGSIQGVKVPEGFAGRLAQALAERTENFRTTPAVEARAKTLANERYGTGTWAGKIP